MSKLSLELDWEKSKSIISEKDLTEIEPEVLSAKKKLDEHTGAGNDFHGWLDLPFNNKEEFEKVKSVAAEINSQAENLISIGIGGSYLGAKATITALLGECVENKPRILFAGQNLSAAYHVDLLNKINFKKTWINVISKSGTTTEPGLAFRILQQKLIETVGESVAKDRIVATTDKEKGALRKLAGLNGYRRFIIPDDVGGRFSVLTPVGLLPVAAAGIDIDALMAGAQDMAQRTRQSKIEENPALLYAALRNILLRKGKAIEILANFEPNLHYVGEWWKQLYGESEGKQGKGIFPAAVDLSTDLHSMGQLIQDGTRNIFETFLIIQESEQKLTIPSTEDDYDGFNYLAGKTLAYVNQKAYEGTAQAHADGGCPNMTIQVPQLSAYWLGQLFYFFEYAVGVSGYLLGVNPFDQPGVEAYKANMFKLLGKPEL